MRLSSTSVILALVNVLNPPDNRRALAHAFRLTAPGGFSTGNAAARAFAFQGRCFRVSADWWARRMALRSNAWLARRQMAANPRAEVVLKAIEACPLVCGPCTHLGRAHPQAPSVLRAGIDAATGQCRGRTHIPMALCQPRRQRPCRRDRNEQACRPIYPNGPRHGRLEVECGRSAGGSPLAVGGWPRGTIGSLGAEVTLKSRNEMSEATCDRNQYRAGVDVNRWGQTPAPDDGYRQLIRRDER